MKKSIVFIVAISLIFFIGADNNKLKNDPNNSIENGMFDQMFAEEVLAQTEIIESLYDSKLTWACQSEKFEKELKVFGKKISTDCIYDLDGLLEIYQRVEVMDSVCQGEICDTILAEIYKRVKKGVINGKEADDKLAEIMAEKKTGQLGSYILWEISQN